MKMNVYEYTIKNGRYGSYIGSYTVRAGCPNEKSLQEKLKSHLVGSFIHDNK